MIYDAIIIGGGPAGLTAGIYASRAGKKVMLIERYGIGGQIALSHEIENYSGVKSASGAELTEIMRSQAESFGTEFTFDNIVRLSLEGDVKEVETEYSGVFSAKNIILALGASPKPLGLAEEASYIGMGLSYCAVCDGMFFKNKTVAVTGGGDTALTDALYLSNIAKKVYIIHRRDEYRGSKILADKLKAAKNIEEVLSCRILSLDGTPLSGINIEHIPTGERRYIETDGLFVAVGTVPQTQIVEGLLPLDGGYIVTDEEMRTAIPGVYAAGDVRKKSLRQVITACADGAVAGSNI